MPYTYDEQMQFIDRYIRQTFLASDKARLERIKEKEDKQRIFFRDEFLAIDYSHELDTTTIGYKPLGEHTRYPNESFLAPDAHNLSEKTRSLSRARLIWGPIDFYLKDKEPTAINLISTCAPNLMGTSPADLRKFSEGGTWVEAAIVRGRTIPAHWENRQLIKQEYQRECEKIADFIVKTAVQNHQDRLIMPAFGVGVYINTLSAESKEAAEKIMFEAFAKAAQQHDLKVDWIVWSKDPESQQKLQRLQRYTQTGSRITPLCVEDMLLYAKDLQEKHGESVTILNPGSDRTVGGRYTARNPKTLEEQIAQQSDLIFLHTKFNKPMVERFYKELDERVLANPPAPQPTQPPAPQPTQPPAPQPTQPPAPQPTQPPAPRPTQPPAPRPVTQIDFDLVSKQINKVFSVTTTSSITDVVPPKNTDPVNIRIAFLSSDDANSFVEQLKTIKDMQSRKHPGQAKTVQHEGQEHCVYFSLNQYRKLEHYLKDNFRLTTKPGRKEDKISLSEAQKNNISKLINRLQREIDSCWPFPNKDRKQVKVDALQFLIQKAETDGLEDAIRSVKHQYPDAFKGTVSRRTADLINDLESSMNTNHQRNTL